MKNLLIYLILMAGVLVSCSETENPIVPDDDFIAPNAITDLSVAFTTGNSATLYLTATGDDSLLGRARIYDVRYSISMLDSANFALATKFTPSYEPNVATIPDTIDVPGLLSNTKYYFAVKIGDEASNWSQISNIDSATTLLSGNWAVYNTSNSEIPLNDITDIQFDGDLKYIATKGGVSSFDNSNWDMIFESRIISYIDTTIIAIDTTIDTIYTGIPNFVNSIAIESADKIWLGTNSSGVALFEGDSLVYYSSNDSGLLTTTTDILISQNKLWVGTSGNGLNTFSLDGSNLWEKYNIPMNNTFPFNGRINCIEVDINNAIWSGLQIAGATVFDNSVFTNYGENPNFTNGQVLDIYSDGNKVLFGTDDGAFVFENGNWTDNFVAVDSGLPDNTVTAVAIDLDGTYWFGTEFGLASFDGSTWTVFTTSNSYLPNNYITTLNVDMFGSLWIGTENGLARFLN